MAEVKDDPIHMKTKKIFCIITLFSLLHVIQPAKSQRIPENPCPDVFQYYTNDQGNIYGEATVPYDGAKKLLFTTNTSIAGLFNQKVKLTIQLATPRNAIESSSQVKYHIYFPFTDPIPKITEITYNRRIYCSGPPEQLIPGGSGVTSLWASYIYQYYTMKNRVAATNSGDFNPVRESTFYVAEVPERGTRPDVDQSVVDTNPNVVNQVPMRYPRPGTAQIPATGTRPVVAEMPVEEPTLNFVETTTRMSTTTQRGATFTSSVLNSGPRTSSSSLNRQCVTHTPSVVPLILGGTNTKDGQFPWLTAVFTYNVTQNGYGYKCTANLISERHVITAGRCVQYYRTQIVPTENILLVLGRNDLTHWATNGAVTRGASKVHVHPDFMKNSHSAHADIAVITFDKPVEFSTQVSPICLWDLEDVSLDPFVDKRGTIAGWGKVEQCKDINGKLNTFESQHVQLTIVSQFDCLKSNPVMSKITSEMTFCAGGESGRGPCIGDSGAGFIISMNGVYFLRGIASIEPNVENNNYAIFCDVAKFMSWVKRAMLF